MKINAEEIEYKCGLLKLAGNFSVRTGVKLLKNIIYCSVILSCNCLSMQQFFI